MRWPNRFRETCRETSQRALFGAGSFAERHARDEMEIGDGWILLDTGNQFFPIDVGKRDIHDGEMKGIVAKRVDAPYRAGRQPAWVKIKNRDCSRRAAVE